MMANDMHLLHKLLGIFHMIRRKHSMIEEKPKMFLLRYYSNNNRLFQAIKLWRVVRHTPAIVAK